MSKPVRLLIDIVQILLGIAAGIYALVQLGELQTALQVGEQRQNGSYATGTVTGSAIGLALGVIVCGLLFWNAFRRKKKRPTGPDIGGGPRSH